VGIPLYGYHWYTGEPTVDKATGDEKPNPSADYISTPDALQLATAFGASWTGMRQTTAPFSISTETRCGSGFFIPICALFATAINWRRTAGLRGSVPGCWDQRIRRSGVFFLTGKVSSNRLDDEDADVVGGECVDGFF